MTAHQTDPELEDAARLMEAWAAYFACREALAQAVRAGYQPTTDEPLILKRMEAAERLLERTRALLDAVQRYAPLLHNSAEGSKRELLSRIEAEQAYLERLDIRTLIRPTDAGGGEPEGEAFELTDALLAPSPIQEGGAAFLFRLGAGADLVVVDIYTAAGRRVARVEGGTVPGGQGRAVLGRARRRRTTAGKRSLLLPRRRPLRQRDAPCRRQVHRRALTAKKKQVEDDGGKARNGGGGAKMTTGQAS